MGHVNVRVSPWLAVVNGKDLKDGQKSPYCFSYITQIAREKGFLVLRLLPYIRGRQNWNFFVFSVWSRPLQSCECLINSGLKKCSTRWGGNKVHEQAQKPQEATTPGPFSVHCLIQCFFCQRHCWIARKQSYPTSC